MPFCTICRFQIVDTSTSVCPNCGAPLEKPKPGDEDAVEQAAPSGLRAQQSNPVEGAPDDTLEICDPGDLLCADSEPESPPVNREIIGRTTPPSPTSPTEDPRSEVDKAEGDSDTKGHQIKKLSEEQVNNIRSTMLEGESEYIAPQDASSIIHDLSYKSEGPNLQRRESQASSSDPPAPHAPPPDWDTPAASSGKPAPDLQLMEPPKTAPGRRIAYFHKNFIQLTGTVHPTTGEEMIIEDRHYLLKPKKIKQQYAIAMFAVIVALLLFIIGKQFISPTLPGSGTIVGVILDDKGRPLISGAEIALPEAGKKTTSDAIGFFRFDNVSTGVYVIRYTLPDGRVGTENISVAGNEITTLSLGTGAAKKTTSAAASSRRSRSSGRSANPPETGSDGTPAPGRQTAEAQTQPDTKYSALKLQANVDNAKLVVDGEALGVGNLTYKKLLPGKHTAKVVKNGYQPWSGTINLKPDETYKLAVTLNAIPAGTSEPSYSAEDFYESGKTVLAEGNIDAAVADLTEAINLDPSMADAYISRGEAYQATGKVKLAETDYIRAGEIYRSKKRTGAALDAFSRAININEKSVPALLNRGDLYLDKDDKGNALQDYKAVVKWDKDNFRGNFQLGKLYFAMGNHKDADKRLRIACEVDSRVPQVYHYLMLNYLARDDFNKVKDTYSDFKQNVSEDEVQAFKENRRYDAILRIVGEYERP